GWPASARLSWSGPAQSQAAPIGPQNFRSTQTWQQRLAGVPEFLARTGLSFPELLDLLGTRFVNPNPAAPRVKLQPYGDPCDLATTRLGGLADGNDASLTDVHRFIRLWRRLGGPMVDLDRAIAAFGPNLDVSIQQIGIARHLQDGLATQFGVRVPWK